MPLNKLKNLAGNITKRVDIDKINLDDILTDSFIQNNTKLKTVQEFIDKSGFDIVSLIDFRKIPMDALNDYVKSISEFRSWKDMLKNAAKDIL
ncbi:MAG: hypothetical protein GX347_03250 [Epulopiscium sp.]|nr:hypothetical protein [Candidatus Epulonipiscium sp.]